MPFLLEGHPLIYMPIGMSLMSRDTCRFRALRYMLCTIRTRCGNRLDLIEIGRAHNRSRIGIGIRPCLHGTDLGICASERRRPHNIVLDNIHCTLWLDERIQRVVTGQLPIKRDAARIARYR